MKKEEWTEVEMPLEEQYSYKMVRAIKDCLTNENSPNFIDIESKDFEVLHFLHALKNLMPNAIESCFYE